LRDFLESFGFFNQARKSPKYFTRERKMPFKKLIYFPLSMIKESSRNALERYFGKLCLDIHMSQRAFSLARQKLKWEAFQQMFEVTVEASCRGEIKRWHGYRLLAIDGSKINPPNDPELREYFGTSGAGNGSPRAQGSILYDIENDVVMDARIEPMDRGERTLAAEHIKKLTGMGSFGKEIILFDRGYASMELIEPLLKAGIDFVTRVREKFDVGIDSLGRGDREARLEKGGRGPVRVRVIKFKLPGGEMETLVSGLRDRKYGMGTFKRLYFRRWPIEGKYDEVKKKLEVENFSGILADNIRRDFYAAMCLTNIAAGLYEEAREGVEEEQRGKENKWKYQVNVNHEVGVLKDRLIIVLLEEDGKRRGELFDEVIRLLKSRLIPIRPNRSIPRTPPRKVKFHHNHKSNC
jgi:hypothetical protein